MTKKELIKMCNKLINRIADLESTVSSLLDDVKQLTSLADELPAELSDIEDDEDEQDSNP